MDFSQALAILWPTINLQLRLSSLATYYLWGNYVDYVHVTSPSSIPLAPLSHAEAASAPVSAPIASTGNAVGDVEGAPIKGRSSFLLSNGSGVNGWIHESDSNSNALASPVSAASKALSLSPHPTGVAATYAVAVATTQRKLTRTTVAHAFIKERIRRTWERRVEFIICIILVVLGIALLTHGLVSIYRQQAKCEEEVGALVWAECSPRIYFNDGTLIRCTHFITSHLMSGKYHLYRWIIWEARLFV
jgi:hypothetical protein